MTRLLLFLSALLAPSAFATITLDGNVFISATTTPRPLHVPIRRLLWDAAASIDLTKKGQLMIGWDYNSASFKDNVNSTPTTVTATGMGPKLMYYFDKDRHWDLGFTYDLILNGTDSTGTNTTLSGTAMKAEAGYCSEVSDIVYLGLKLNYYMATFTETITNQTTIAHVSYHRNVIYPSVAFILRWD